MGTFENPESKSAVYTRDQPARCGRFICRELAHPGPPPKQRSLESTHVSRPSWNPCFGGWGPRPGEAISRNLISCTELSGFSKVPMAIFGQVLAKNPHGMRAQFPNLIVDGGGICWRPSPSRALLHSVAVQVCIGLAAKKRKLDRVGNGHSILGVVWRSGRFFLFRRCRRAAPYLSPCTRGGFKMATPGLLFFAASHAVLRSAYLQKLRFGLLFEFVLATRSAA